MTTLPVTESELHAYVDGALPESRSTEVETYLASHPEDAERVANYRRQNEALAAQYGAIADERVPDRLRTVPRSRRNYAWHAAAAVSWMTLGGIIGWQVQAYRNEQGLESASWPRRAAMAHAVYSPEVRHPVEVGAEQETHLVNWLSKRLGAPLKVPHLGGLGYTLVGGRLLPGDRGPVAQFMYQDSKGQRLTLYVRTNSDDTRETAFRFAQENNVGVFYWLDRKLGYALSGEVDKSELLRVATTVYRQLNP
ncbi:MAG TPA: anti-sigma factor [Burkholderiales bacterium]|nr:anti-sigma factor [Burkholderiales bacterium]